MANTTTLVKSWEELRREFPELLDIKTQSDLAKWSLSHRDIEIPTEAYDLLDKNFNPEITDSGEDKDKKEHKKHVDHYGPAEEAEKHEEEPSKALDEKHEGETAAEAVGESPAETTTQPSASKDSTIEITTRETPSQTVPEPQNQPPIASNAPEESDHAKRLNQARTVVKNNVLATRPPIDYETIAFNVNKKNDPLYQKKLSETEALWLNKYEYRDKTTNKVIPRTEYFENHIGDPNVSVEESPLWDRSLDNYTAEQLADKEFLEEIPDAKKRMLAIEKTKTYANPNDDPFLKATREAAGKYVDVSLDKAQEGKHFFTDAITIVKNEDLRFFYEESSRAYLRDFIEEFPEKAQEYNNTAQEDPDNYQLRLLQQEYQQEQEQGQEEERQNELARLHDEIVQESPPRQAPQQNREQTQQEQPTQPTYSTGQQAPSQRYAQRREQEERARREAAKPHDHADRDHAPEGRYGQGAPERPTTGASSKKKRLKNPFKKPNLLPSNPVTGTLNKAKTALNIARALFSMGPLGWGLVIAAIIIIYVVVFGSGSPIDLGGGSATTPETTGTPKKYLPIPGLTLSLVGPDSRANGDLLGYTATISYDPSKGGGPIENITVFDNLPTELEFVPGQSSGKFSQNGQTIEWPLSDASNRTTISIVVRPKQSDINTANKISARTISSVGVPATTNDCAGKYAAIIQGNPLKLNFGDPGCDYTEDQLYTALKDQDPKNADIWFYLARCESGRNPNAFLGASTSGAGAYGLFQMNPTGSGSTKYDAGDVSWQPQISNAIGHNKINSNKFEYWERNPQCQWYQLLQ